MTTPTLEYGSQAAIIEEAVAFINSIRQECALLGANDSELPTLARLAEAVENRLIDPADAKAQAQAIRNAKQEYH